MWERNGWPLMALLRARRPCSTGSVCRRHLCAQADVDVAGHQRAGLRSAEAFIWHGWTSTPMQLRERLQRSDAARAACHRGSRAGARGWQPLHNRLQRFDLTLAGPKPCTSSPATLDFGCAAAQEHGTLSPSGMSPPLAPAWRLPPPGEWRPSRDWPAGMRSSIRLLHSQQLVTPLESGRAQTSVHPLPDGLAHAYGALSITHLRILGSVRKQRWPRGSAPPRALYPALAAAERPPCACMALSVRPGCWHQAGWRAGQASHAVG